MNNFFINAIRNGRTKRGLFSTENNYFSYQTKQSQKLKIYLIGL